MGYEFLRNLFKKRSNMNNDRKYKIAFKVNHTLRICIGLLLMLIPFFTTFAQISLVGSVTNSNGANVQTLTVNKPTGAVIGDLFMTIA